LPKISLNHNHSEQQRSINMEQKYNHHRSYHHDKNNKNKYRQHRDHRHIDKYSKNERSQNRSRSRDKGRDKRDRKKYEKKRDSKRSRKTQRYKSRELNVSETDTDFDRDRYQKNKKKKQNEPKSENVMDSMWNYQKASDDDEKLFDVESATHSNHSWNTQKLATFCDAMTNYLDVAKISHPSLPSPPSMVQMDEQCERIKDDEWTRFTTMFHGNGQSIKLNENASEHESDDEPLFKDAMNAYSSRSRSTSLSLPHINHPKDATNFSHFCTSNFA